MFKVAGLASICLGLLVGVPATFGQTASNRLIVRFAPGLLEPPGGRTAGAVQEFSFATLELRDALVREGVEYLTRLFPGARSEDQLSTNLIGEPVILDELSQFFVLSLGAGRDSGADLRLRVLPGVQSAEWPRLGRPLYTPNDQYFGKQWGLHNTAQNLCSGYLGPALVADSDTAATDINAPEAWDIDKGLNASVRVGIIDSGIRATHEDFGGRVNADSGISFVPVYAPGECNGASQNCTSTPAMPTDDMGHGTGVASIVAASGDNQSRGMAGIAWGVTPIDIKVIFCGGGGAVLSCNSARALDWARAKSIPIVNMSYNTGGPSDVERAAVRNAFYAGMLMVGGAGNDNNGLIIYPAKYTNMVCAAGAFFANGRRWNDFVIDGNPNKGSCWGPGMDLSAPGGSKIVAAGHNSDAEYRSLSTCSDAFGGTSAAAPVVSGVAALIRSKYNAHGASGTEPLLGEDLYQVMIRTARHPDPNNPVTQMRLFEDSTLVFFDDSAGYGHVRADTALKLLALPRKVYHQRATALAVVDSVQTQRSLLNIPGVPNGVYTVKCYVMRKALTFNPAFESKPMGWVRSSGTAGVKNVDPYDYNEEVNWGRIVGVTATTCTLETNVFKIVGVAPPYDWFPILPTKAAVALTTVGAPTGGGGGGASAEPVPGDDTDRGRGLPSAFALRQNRPNPFEGKTTVRFELPVRTRVRLDIFDAQGRRVRTLANAQFPPGFHAVDWDNGDTEGRVMKPGVYLYRLHAGSFRDQRKMVLLAR